MDRVCADSFNGTLFHSKRCLHLCMWRTDVAVAVAVDAGVAVAVAVAAVSGTTVAAVLR